MLPTLMNPRRAMLLRTLPVLALLSCLNKADQPRVEGESCVDSLDCQRGLTCAQDAVCRTAGTPGTLPVGAECATTAQCGVDLVCAGNGTCSELGSAGTASTGESCTTEADCRFGLTCPDGTCRGLEVPFWPGRVCPDPDDDSGPFRVLFQIPRDDVEQPFYALPFPNNIRMDDSGTITLSDHPSPGPLIDVVGDVVGDVLRVASRDLRGYGANQAVFMRFSNSPDFDSLFLGSPDQGTVSLVDITPDFEGRGNVRSVSLRASTGRGAYICHNWIAVRPSDGVPLLPSHTYAVIVSRDVTDPSGTRLTPDDDFAAVMAAEAPNELLLQSAWIDYGPLRLWLAEEQIDAARIGGATVFTIQDTNRGPDLLHRAVQEADAPVFESPVVCGTDADAYAVADDPDRGCQTDSTGAFSELQSVVGLPQFQSGTPPFKDAVDGGAIEFRSTPPIPDRVDSVHVTLTVPNGVPMPAGGWPVVLYGHGTGGNYTSAIRGGIAEELSAVELGEDTVHFATLGFDAPLHGARTFPQNWKAEWLEVDPDAYDSDTLYFNPLNIRASRDNALQSAADLWSLVRLLTTDRLEASDTSLGQEIRFDASNIFYVGHSQGGVVAPVFLARETAVRAAVLSGAGGTTIRALLEKTSPHNVPAILRVGLVDPDISREHPLLNIAQQVSERADGVNHARYLMREPPEGRDRMHLLQIYGVDDTYSPNATQTSLARALGLDQVPGANVPLEGFGEVSLPVSGNTPEDTTAVVHLYSAAGRDAHFVLFDREDAMHHLRTFLGTAVRDGVPTVLPL